MSDGGSGSIKSSLGTGLTVNDVPRNEPSRSVMVKEIDSLKRQIMHLHLVAPWNETVLGGAIGVVTSAIFGLIGYYQSNDAPQWIEIAMIGLLVAGFVAGVLCLVFRKSMSGIEDEQKQDIIDELERWKHNGE